MYLIAGLGNPGPKYRTSRHNIGFRTINALAASLGVRLTNRRFQSRNTLVLYRGVQILLVRPITFMNRSGQSIKGLVDHYHVESDRLLVIHDDIDLPVGRIKVARHGGTGGHRGIQSVMNCLGTREFPRIKIGVGRPLHGESIEDYVLSPPYEDEKGVLIDIIEAAVRASKLFISEGLECAMNQINTKNFKEKEVII